MRPSDPALSLGYSAVAPGALANVVTYLEMTERPPPRAAPALSSSLELARFDGEDLEAYRTVYRDVGEEWLWSSRLLMSDAELGGIVRDPRVEAYFLRSDAGVAGLLELDFRQAGECELAFFGLAKAAIGRGIGRYLMERAIARAWMRPIRRFWVHTCTFDHPAALPFYRRSGFRPYAFGVEMMADPRLTGVLARTAAPHVPLVEK